jgi:histidyl-tRNA synthetase
MRPVHRIRGMSDQPQAVWRKKRRVQELLQELIGSYGYSYLETPILEPTELFLRKSGGQLASRLYNFTDPGSNPVTLRPEFTAPIMRHYLEHAGESDLPVRWQYSGPVFRYEDQGGAGGQFTQIGAELLGSASVAADVEMVALAASIPSQLGIKGYQVKLADLDLLNSVLDTTGISERARDFVISAVPSLQNGASSIPRALEQADRLRLTAGGIESDRLSRGIEGLDNDQARKVLQGMLQWSAGERLGQRDPEDVVDRMLRKLRGSDTEEDLQTALELASRLASIKGAPLAALEAARSVVKDAGAATGSLDRLQEFLELIAAGSGIEEHLTIELGLLRGLAYYNGIVFEVCHPSSADALGGGGRYDGLARALGSPDPIAALGFAYNLESLMELSPGAGDDASPEDQRPLVLVVGDGLGTDSGFNPGMLKTAEELRRKGAVVELDVSNLGPEEALNHARRLGMDRVVAVGPHGTQTTHELK